MTKPATINDYIAACSPDVRTILRKIRKVVRDAAPGATEAISYGIPAFKGTGTLVYFAAFKKHIGFFPPIRVKQDADKAAAARKPRAGSCPRGDGPDRRANRRRRGG